MWRVSGQIPVRWLIGCELGFWFVNFKTCWPVGKLYLLSNGLQHSLHSRFQEFFPAWFFQILTDILSQYVMGMIVYPSFFVRSSVTGSRGAAFSMTATPNKRTAPGPREPSCGWCVHWKVPTALTGIRTWPHQWQRHCLRAKVPVIVYHLLKNWMTKVVTRNQELLVLSALELIPDSKDNNTSMFLGACFFSLL